MKNVTVIIPNVDDSGTLGGPAVITMITDVRLPGPQGPPIDLTDNGVPDVDLGSNGDYYFRKDGTEGNHIYFKSSNTWTALI